ncbi:uncharacterized protein METZ01_LOCUS280441 [marine metagenome]|uniref:Uncharacterized protein n=1 Tax=marine metagenome TaxID=408172 RepID=A0A382KXV6_9ZZZZ
MTQRQVRAADFHLNRIPQRRPPNQAQPRPRHKSHLPKPKRIITLQVNAIDHTTGARAHAGQGTVRTNHQFKTQP